MVWEKRVADARAWADRRGETALLAVIEELAAELPPDSGVANFERASSFDSAGQPDLAVALYQLALGQGLDEQRRRRAVIQLAGSLRELGRHEESSGLLESELDNGPDELDQEK